MTYVFDPTTNTLIDDEDKSLGNKLGLMDGGRVNFADNPLQNFNPNLAAAAKAVPNVADLVALPSAASLIKIKSLLVGALFVGYVYIIAIFYFILNIFCIL